MIKLTSQIRRGPARGTILHPHIHQDGCFVVSLTRFERDYVRVLNEADLLTWLGRGYRLRMSDGSGRRGPSLIAPTSIRQNAAWRGTLGGTPGRAPPGLQYAV